MTVLAGHALKKKRAPAWEIDSVDLVSLEAFAEGNSWAATLAKGALSLIQGNEYDFEVLPPLDDTSSSLRMGDFANGVEEDGNLQPNNFYLELFPNPTSGELSLSYKLEEGYWSFLLFDIYGRLVLERELEGLNREISLDVSDVENGVYLYKVVNQEREFSSGKLIMIE